MRHAPTAHGLAGALMICVTAAMAMLSARAATAQDVDFAGQTVELVIPFSQGGGSDVWARFHAPLLARHLPGQPSIMVRNEPGSGGTRGSNAFAEDASADGLSLL
ncbi:MAG: tricarboxylate transporter, partial [Methyloversatilis sp.]|nr:tricarboxylate transporter [Methyloversatilis sp.]